MKPVLVDSSVILDVVTDDPRWGRWSAENLARWASETELVINPIILAEVSIGFQKAEEVEAVLPADVFRREGLPWEAAFVAGKAFLSYRRRGGPRLSPLPDFYIGAHAAVRGYAVLTRDAPRYRTYFPQIEVLAPGE